MISKKGRKGNISIVLISMFAFALIIYAFVQYMESNVITMKQENISQYSRDALLILETTGEVDKTYLLNVKDKLASKLDLKSSESLTMKVKVGNGIYYDVTNMPNKITANYGDNLTLKATLKYKSKKISFTGNFLHPITSNTIETIDIETSSISKNRRGSDG